MAGDGEPMLRALVSLEHVLHPGLVERALQSRFLLWRERGIDACGAHVDQRSHLRGQEMWTVRLVVSEAAAMKRCRHDDALGKGAGRAQREPAAHAVAEGGHRARSHEGQPIERLEYG